MKNTLKILLVSLLTWCAIIDASAQTPIPICPQSASFTGAVRGYYFTAPATFTICGIYVEDDMSTAFQAASIVRFTAGPPPAYAGTTNNFVTLWQNLNYAPNNMIPVPTITINAGDIIGIYGARTANSVNSYGPAQCVINIQGFPTTTFRSGMQFDLAAGPGMHDIWNENNGSVGRITMYTNCCPAPTPIAAIAGPTSVCVGDAVTYTVPAQAGATAYNWTVPAGATITGGQNTTSLNVTWNATPGGNICVDWTDPCATSAPTCLAVTVNAPTTPTFNPITAICSGDPSPVLPTTSTNGITGTWSPAVNNTTTTLYTFTPTAGLCATTTTLTITVNPNITPTFNPVATICSGDPLTPLPTTSTNGITGTWSPAINNTTTTLYTFTPTAGLCATTTTLTITVNPIPAAPTALSVTICPNNSTTLTATAPGGTYDWYDAAVGGTLLFTGAGYTTPVLIANTSYWVQTTVNGCTSPRTMVTVTIAAAISVNAGLDTTICDGTPFTLNVTPNGAGYSYVWDEPANMGFSTAFNPTVTPVATTTYTVTVTDPSNCVGTDMVTITVNPVPTVTVPVNATYCDGDPVLAGTFTSTPAGATFTWSNSDPTIGLAAAGTGNTPAFTATNATGSPITATITVTPTLTGCVGTPVSYTITVNPIPTVTVPANATYCNGDPVPAGTFISVPAGGTFTWSNSDPTIGLAATGTGNTPAFTATNATGSPVTATITVTPTVNGCLGAPVIYTITVNPVPTVSVPANAAYCNNDPVPAGTFTSMPAGGSFAWTNSNPTIGLAVAGTGNTPAFTAINATGNPIIATITVTPTVNGCAGSPITYTITINPGAMANVATNITACPGDLVPASTFTSTPAGGTFTWTNSNPTIGLAAAGTGNTPAFTAINTTGNPIFSTVSVVATASGCPGPPSTYNITINPIVTGSTNTAICQGDSISIGGVFVSTAGSYLETLTSSFGCDSILTTILTVNIVSVATTPVVICQGDSILIEGNYYSAATSFPFTYTSSFGCDSIVIYDITVAPLPSFTVTGSAFINLGESVNLAVMPGIVGTTYSWNPPVGLSCLFCQNPIATPAESIWYYVTVTNANGCSTIDSVYIDVDPSSNIYVPNIFSPNEDGNNDIYLISGKGINQFNLAIYNRWGQKVFESDDIEKGWDGTKNGSPLNQGVFVYKLNVSLHTGKTIKQTGNITLVR
ncbi:MAG: gliding motility-associated C-terminal domain-containing protein [Flavobacteriales bacterium]|nr:gliding motility-associated C-terminal domain-containing protein [Flavobacteriales bacterium]